jgi:RimJ/RimL family protein N-acetyltransferase
MRYISDGNPLSAEQADASIERFERSWRDNGFGLWAVEDRSLGRCIGFCGMLVMQDGQSRIEIGWRLERAAWGKGYATEAALPSRDWAFERIATLPRLIALFQPANHASQRVMEKLGMTFDADEADDWGHTVRTYALERAEWERIASRASG